MTKQTTIFITRENIYITNTTENLPMKINKIAFKLLTFQFFLELSCYISFDPV